MPQSIDENRQLTGELYADRETFRQRLQGALNQVALLPGTTDKVVVMGYCFGGAAVLEMARAGMQTDGFVSFHEILERVSTPEEVEFLMQPGSGF